MQCSDLTGASWRSYIQTQIGRPPVLQFQLIHVIIQKYLLINPVFIESILKSINSISLYGILLKIALYVSWCHCQVATNRRFPNKITHSALRYIFILTVICIALLLIARTCGLSLHPSQHVITLSGRGHYSSSRGVHLICDARMN